MIQAMNISKLSLMVLLQPKAVTQSQVLTDGVDTVGARVDYARETSKYLYYDNYTT